MTYGSLRLGEVSKGANVDRKEVHGQRQAYCNVEGWDQQETKEELVN